MFFLLAKHCNMCKHDVYGLTLPQLERYLLECDENVKFEFTANANSIAKAIGKLFGGSDPGKMKIVKQMMRMMRAITKQQKKILIF